MRKLLTPHVRAIGRPPGPAQDDALDPGRVEGTETMQTLIVGRAITGIGAFT